MKTKVETSLSQALLALTGYYIYYFPLIVRNFKIFKDSQYRKLVPEKFPWLCGRRTYIFCAGVSCANKALGVDQHRDPPGCALGSGPARGSDCVLCLLPVRFRRVTWPQVTAGRRENAPPGHRRGRWEAVGPAPGNQGDQGAVRWLWRYRQSWRLNS